MLKTRLMTGLLLATMACTLAPGNALAHNGPHTPWDGIKKAGSAVTGLAGAFNKTVQAVVRVAFGGVGIGNAVEFYRDYGSHSTNASARAMQEAQIAQFRAGVRLPIAYWRMAP